MFEKLCRLVFLPFLNEFSSAFVMFLFNIVLLNLVGHVAISAYAIVANLNIIVIAILQGLGKGRNHYSADTMV